MLIINIENLQENLQYIVKECAKKMKMCIDKNGIVIVAKQSQKNGVSVRLDDNGYFVEYGGVHQFARALKIIRQNAKKKSYFIQEECKTTELAMLLNCSSCAVRTVEHIKEVIKNIALLGYNQLYIGTDDTFEVEDEPYVGYRRGRYSIEEMNAIDDYGAKFGIEIVPTIQALAHQLTMLRWPVYYPITDMHDVMLVGEERTYTLIENMFKSLSKGYKSRKIHIGMDEAFMLGRGKYLDLHGYESRLSILLKHLNRVLEIAQKYGYNNPIIWGDTYCASVKEEKKAKENGLDVKLSTSSFPKNVRLNCWGYQFSSKAEFDDFISEYLSISDDIIFAGSAQTDTNFTPSMRLAFDNIRYSVKACMDYNVQSYLLTLWSDNGGECSDVSALPSICLTAELFYGNENIEEAFCALTGVALDKFMLLELPNVIDENKEPDHSNRCKFMLYNDCLYGLFNYVVQGGEKKIYKSHKEKLEKAVRKTGEYAYLFKTQMQLCDVLTYKYELGVKTQEAYFSKDKEKIKQLVKNEYQPYIKKLKKFYNLYKAQWDKENKQQGFEIHDYRLGGLIIRSEHCAERLLDFANGKINKLPELEEKELTCAPHLLNGGSFWDVRGMISANVF